MLIARVRARCASVPAQLARFASTTSTSVPEDPKNMVLCNVDSDGFATVTLNRPEMFNAFSDVVIARCSEIFEALRKQNGRTLFLFVLRVLLSFSEGNYCERRPIGKLTTVTL